MKTALSVVAFALLIAATIASSLQAAEPVKPAVAASKPKAKFESNVKPLIAKLDAKAGLNIITKTGEGYQFGVKLTKGQVPVYVGISPDGKEIPTTPYQSVVAKETTCWRCFVDEAGDKHCVEIGCPMGTTIWDGSRSLSARQ